MFWKHNNLTSQLDILLAKENVTLQEVMDSEDVLNECRAVNKNLIDFLLRPEVFEELVNLTTKEPSLELDEDVRYKYPTVACELLTCDIPALKERLAGDEALLEKLYAFLENEPPLNPLLASYFSRIMGALIAKKTEQNWLSYQLTCLQVLDFLKAKDMFISLLLKHLGTSAIMDLMLKLMTEVEGIEVKQNVLNWLDSQRIIQSLVSLLNPKIEKERHSNVAQLLCDFLRIARDNQRNSTERADPDPLLNTLESSEIISQLFDEIFGEEKVESAIIGGIQILLALLDTNHYSIIDNKFIHDEVVDQSQRQIATSKIAETISSRIRDFHELLLNPPKQSSIVTTVGTLDPPLGYTRLQVVKLFSALISSKNSNVLQEFVSAGTFPVLINLFFQYPWNNFLHTQVENCLISAFESYVTKENDENTIALCKHLLVNCNLIEKTLKAWKDNDEQQSKEKGLRLGYMGHLISIVNKIVEMCSSSPLGQFIKDCVPEVAKSLDEFKESTLSEANKIQATLLGGIDVNTCIENNDEYGDIQFPQSSAIQQQMFSNYQMQHLTSQCIDGYSGYNDDSFNDGDDTLQHIDHRTDMNFDLSENDFAQQREIFKQVCAQNINTLDDADDQIFDDKEHTFQTVIEKQSDKNEQALNSDSDDELFFGDESMEFEANKAKVPDYVMNTSDPWSTAPSEPSPTETNKGGWADFSSVKFEENIKAVSSDAEKCEEGVCDKKETSTEVNNVNICSKAKDEGSSESTTATSIAKSATTNVEANDRDSESVEKSAAGDHCHDDKNVVTAPTDPPVSIHDSDSKSPPETMNEDSVSEGNV